MPRAKVENYMFLLFLAESRLKNFKKIGRRQKREAEKVEIYILDVVSSLGIPMGGKVYMFFLFSFFYFLLFFTLALR